MLDRPGEGAARGDDAHRRRGALDRRRGRRPLPRRVRRRAARRPARGVPRGGPGAARRDPAPLRPHPRPVHHARAGGAATRIDVRPALRELEQAGDLVRGELRPGGIGARVVRPRGAAPAAPRLAGVAAQGGRARRAEGARAASFPRGRAWTPRRRAAPAWTGCARCSCRSRAWRWRPRCGSATCCRAGWAPTRPPGWTSSAPSGELVWVGAGALGKRSGKVALLFREDARWVGPPPVQGRARRASRSTTCCASDWRRAPRSGPTCSPTSWTRPSPPTCRRCSGTSCGRAR